jgi:hypothetical protein
LRLYLIRSLNPAADFSDPETIKTRPKAHKPADSGAVVGNGARIRGFQEVTLNTIKHTPLKSPHITWGTGCIWERLVGWQAAIAGKPAPTVGLGTSGRDWSAVRPPSRASSLPQGIGCIWERLVGCQAAIAGRPAPTVGLGASGRDWLAGRPPSLASSLPQGIGCIWERLVGWQAAIAGKPAPTVGLGASERDWSAVRPPSSKGRPPFTTQQAER